MSTQIPTISSINQIQIPVEHLERLGWHSGQPLIWVECDHGLLLRRLVTVNEVFGLPPGLYPFGDQDIAEYCQHCNPRVASSSPPRIE